MVAYLLGLLAMIKCSICSYQCDNWYVSNWRLACHINFCLGRCSLELAQRPLCVALAWHLARRSTPFGVTIWKKPVVFASRHVIPTLTLTIICGNSYIRAGLPSVSQRSLHNAPIFRLLLKVAVNGTHQCDFLNFCGDLGPQHQSGKLILSNMTSGHWSTHPDILCNSGIHV